VTLARWSLPPLTCPGAGSKLASSELQASETPETGLRLRFSLASLMLAFVLRPAPSAFAVSKEIIQMQQQLQTLQQAVDNLQKTVDTQTAVLKTLIEQADDSVNSMKAQMAELQRTNGQNLATSNSRFDSVTGQIQALSESLEEAKGRLGKLSDQLTQTQNIIQTLNGGQPQGNGTNSAPGPNGASSAAPNSGSVATGGAGPPRSLPDPDSLYKSGMTDYSGGRYELAIQEFQEYLQDYGDTDLASNAQFYVGDSYYIQKKYSEAVEQFNKCLERYPNGSKLAVAQLHKAYALVALGQTQAGERELRSLIKRFPSSHEAELARQRLKKLS
jgi:tol-pal system protein YbgF